MQTKTWTRNEFIDEFGEFGTVREAVSAVEKTANEDGNVVCRIRVNDVAFSETEEKRLSNIQFSEMKTFSIDFDEQDAVISNVRTSILDYIERVKAASLETSEKFRSEDVKSAHSMFSSVIDAMSCVWDVLSDIKNVESHGQAPKEKVREWLKLEEDFLSLTKEISDAYQAEDYFLVSDLLEYEFPNQLDIWSAKVKA